MSPSYSRRLQQPAWLLLDEDYEIVASVRAPSRPRARALFEQHRLRGKYLYRYSSWDRLLSLRARRHPASRTRKRARTNG